MDLIKDPAAKDAYNACKYRVKLWEHEFKKEHGRPPSKLDIREAEKEVRLAYKTYFNLKSAALEQSFVDVDGFQSDEEEDEGGKERPDNKEFDIVKESSQELLDRFEGIEDVNTSKTWGDHLNNKKLGPETEKTREKSTVNLSFSRKLFDRSKFSKRNPRKSLSFHHRRSESSLPETKSLSQPARSSSCVQDDELSLLLSLDASLENLLNPEVGCKVVSGTNRANTQPVSVIQSILGDEYKPRKAPDLGWVNRVAGDAFTNENTVGDFAFSQGFVEERATQLDPDSDDVIENSDEESRASQSLSHVAKKMRTDVRNNSAVKMNQNKDGSMNESSNAKDSEVSESKGDFKEAKGKKRKKSARLRKTVNFKEDSDSDGGDPYVYREDKTRPKDTGNVYELEYSVRPRLMTTPRISRAKRIVDSRKHEVREGEGERRRAKEKLERKIESGNLNENFVRINLKKKVFVRGKKSVNFGKYKKQMWKNKKKMLASDGGGGGGFEGESPACFGCGRIGHFARQCPDARGDGLLPLSAGGDAENEGACRYPTLEEAARMARESALAFRKPSVTVENSTDLKGAETDEGDAFEDSECEEELLAEVLKLEKHVAQLDMKQYMDSTSVVRPYYDESDDFTAPSEVLDVLKMFGHVGFRPGQERAVMRILSGKSTLVTLSTGSGKSLCYQLPAYMYSRREPCLSLVISPLVSLMEDQVTGIPTFLKAACLHTNQTKTQRAKIMEAVASGSLNVLLVSPEAIVAGERTTGFSSILRKLPPIAFACIDEAHCVSQWSHNFRPSYLMICRILRESLGVRTILGLTATATRSTGDGIVRHLRVPDGRDGIISDVPLPDNLRLTVSRDPDRDRALLGLLLSERFAACRSIIVYCTRRDECERVAAFLRTSLKEERQVDGGKKRKRIDVQAEPYHAGMSAGRRKSIQGAFMSDALRIVVATVAFGMGINKSDIRAVIHYNMPSSFESYVQEVGRAGRDGLPAHCHLFLDSQGKDENELRRHIHANSVDRHAIRKLLQKIFVPCACTADCPKHEVAFSIEETVQALDLPEENISTLLCYLELHEKRYVQVLSPAYTNCKIISYAGPEQIKRAAEDCPPLAMALALFNKNKSDESVFEFPIVDAASAMGWDSGICKHKLKNLEWTSVNNQPKRSPLSVQFSNLGFRLLAPGNLPDPDLDDALDSLHRRVVDQERKRLLQLRALSATVNSTAQKSYKLCVKEEEEAENVLKDRIRAYFESIDPLEDVEDPEERPVDEDAVAGNTRALVCMYRDTVFTGRAVARVFHGIQSPNFPAFIWGRCKFWRAHVHEDFHAVCRIATGEILKMR